MKKSSVLKAMGLTLAVVVGVTSFAGCGKKELTVPSFSADTIKVGGTGPLSGEASSYGISVNNGAKLAIKEINDNGGLDGVMFSYEMVDDEAGSSKASQGYQTLKTKGMQVSIGSVTSGSCLAFANAAVADNMFAITPSGSQEDIINAGNNIFRVCFSDPEQSAYAASVLYTKTKVGIIYNTDDSYSTGLYNAFKEAMGPSGYNVAFETQSFKSDTTNFDAQVTALQAKGVTDIYLAMYYEKAYSIITAANAKGYNVNFFGSDGLDGIAAIDKSGIVSGVKYMTPFDVNSQNQYVSKFVNAYKKAYNSTPDQFAADGYDAVMVIYEGLKAAKAADSTLVIDGSTSCSVITEALKATITSATFKVYGPTAPEGMSFSTTGKAQKAITVVTLD